MAPLQKVFGPKLGNMVLGFGDANKAQFGPNVLICHCPPFPKCVLGHPQPNRLVPRLIHIRHVMASSSSSCLPTSVAPFTPCAVPWCAYDTIAQGAIYISLC